MKTNSSPPLARWSWQEIIKVYRHFGEQLKEYQRLKPVFGVDDEIDLTPRPGMIIPVASFEQALAVGRWLQDVSRINDQIKALDQEIARRNKMIGVMG